MSLILSEEKTSSSASFSLTDPVLLTAVKKWRNLSCDAHRYL